jgi:predicted RNA-binding protein YlxR (DUF448 family)
MKHKPIRTCIVTRQPFEKEFLIRVTKLKNGTIEIDQTGRGQGRGAYISKDVKVIEIAQKKGQLSRALEAKIPDDIFESLKALCHE